VDTNDWMILKTINEERSLTKTAKRLYISQPSLTYRLNKLEKELGVTILNRHSTGVSFTIQGEYILKYSEEMLEKLRFIKNSVQNMNEPVSGTLRLGISTVFAKFKLAPILKMYHNRFPYVEIDLKTGSSTLQLPDMLENRTVDVIIRRGDFNWPEKKHILFEEPCGLVSAYPIEFNQLPSIPWIQDDMAPVTNADKEFYDWWQSNFSSSPPTNIIQVNSIEACIQMVSEGLGWTVLPKIHITNRRSLYFRPLTWSHGQPMLQKTVMAYRYLSFEQPAVRTFIDFILNEYSHVL
jgi:DNA-binding transcriptional LysR family regulator